MRNLCSLMIPYQVLKNFTVVGFFSTLAIFLRRTRLISIQDNASQKHKPLRWCKEL